MSVDRRLLNWGIFLVLLGGIPLAVSQGWISSEAVARAWELWPLILVGAGIGLILGQTALRALGGIIVAGTFGVILGAVVAVGFGGFSVGNIGCGPADAGAPRILDERGTFTGGSARVSLQANCAEVRVGAAPGAAWSVTVAGNEEARPTIDEGGGLAVRSPATPAVFPFGGRRATWEVGLGTDPRLDLELDVNAGALRADLGGATVGRLDVEGNAIGDSRLDLSGATVDDLAVAVNAADLAILLPAASDLRGTVSGNAASVGLCASPGVGLRFVVEENITASDNFDEEGLVQRGDAWESADFATAATRIELRIRGAAVSYTLNPEDGCR